MSKDYDAMEEWVSKFKEEIDAAQLRETSRLEAGTLGVDSDDWFKILVWSMAQKAGWRHYVDGIRSETHFLRDSIGENWVVGKGDDLSKEWETFPTLVEALKAVLMLLPSCKERRDETGDFTSEGDSQ